MHCDTIAEIMVRKRRGEDIGLAKNSLMIDLEKLKAGGYSVQNFAMFVYLGEKSMTPFEMVSALLKTFKEEMEANQALISQVYNTEDIRRNETEGKLSALLTIEEGGACEGSLDKLRYLYDQGVRMMTLTWNFANGLGYPNLAAPDDVHTPNTKDGLTKLGLEFVQEMERLGMIVDVSHLSDAGFYDVLHHTTRPFVASHSNARSVCGHVRNLTDDMIRALAERGGVTGLNYSADFLRDQPPKNPSDEENKLPYATLADIARHARYITNVGGMECLGLGSDFDGIPPHPELPDASRLPMLAEALKAQDFHESEIDKILYGNVYRVYRDVLG
jgi:membrane dipeptidase